MLAGRDHRALEEVARSAPERAHVLVADLTTELDVIERACALAGGLDGLVHAAGVATHARLDRRLGTPSEVAHALAFLLDAEWATGSVLTLDGGLTAA